MDIPQQVLLTTFVGIITFFLGKKYEQRAVAQRNRLELLAPVEEWVDTKSHLLNIMRADLYLLAGMPNVVATPSKDDIDKTVTLISEQRLKVFGILESEVLNTFGTKRLSKKLLSLLEDVEKFDNELYDAHDKAKLGIATTPDVTEEIKVFDVSRASAREKLLTVYSCISELKIKLN